MSQMCHADQIHTHTERFGMTQANREPVFLRTAALPRFHSHNHHTYSFTGTWFIISNLFWNVRIEYLNRCQNGKVIMYLEHAKHFGRWIARHALCDSRFGHDRGDVVVVNKMWSFFHQRIVAGLCVCVCLFVQTKARSKQYWFITWTNTITACYCYCSVEEKRASCKMLAWFHF